jgi:hypothetical protein
MSAIAKGEVMFQKMSGEGESRSSSGNYVAVVDDGLDVIYWHAITPD